MALLTLLLSGLVGLLTAALFFYSWHFNYWKKRNVPYFNPSSLSNLIASRFRSFFSVWPMYLMLEDAYWSFPDQPFVGFFFARRPAIVMRDPDLVKLVLTKEFSSFHDRGIAFDEKNDPLSVNLLSLPGERWKNLRTKLSPVFSSGKLKLMLPLMEDAVKDFKDILKKWSDAGEEVEMKELLVRFATDIVGSCAFGANCHALKDPSSEFFMMGKSFFDNTALITLSFLFGAINPVLLRLLPFKSMFRKPFVFFADLMKQTIEFREKNGIERNDFVSVMMKLRHQASEDIDLTKDVRFNDEHMLAEAFVFFSAGLDTVANSAGFCLYELAYNQDVQRRIAKEVHDVVQKHGGSLSYDALREMDLLEAAILEALRLYSPTGALFRETTKPFKMPNSDLTLEQGTLVFIPVRQLHLDPAYFPDPERFDIDRFTEEAKEARHPYVFQPFGEGPRFCIAKTFAMLEMKLLVASVLQDFHLSPGRKSEAKPKMQSISFGPTPKNGFWIKVEKRT